MNTIRTKLAQFMRGRYGHDDLNLFMLVMALLINFAAIFTKVPFCSVLSLVLLVLINYRGLSKNVVKRVAENRKFRELTVVPRRMFKAMRLASKDKGHSYVLCPSCHQICRVPKGRGKIEVKCPSCHTSFEKKS